MKKSFGILITVITLSISYTSVAADKKLSENHDILAQKLDLSAEQMAKIEAIKNHTEKNLESIDVNSVSSYAIVKAFESGKWDEKAIKQEIDQIGKIQSQARYYRVQFLFEANQVLTKPQREKLGEIIKQHELY